jgi:hypothetical protein
MLERCGGALREGVFLPFGFVVAHLQVVSQTCAFAKASPKPNSAWYQKSYFLIATSFLSML